MDCVASLSMTWSRGVLDSFVRDAAVVGGRAAGASFSGGFDRATEGVEGIYTTARAVLGVGYRAVCSVSSLVGASRERRRPSGPSRDSRAGSSEPSDALVG